MGCNNTHWEGKGPENPGVVAPLVEAGCRRRSSMRAEDEPITLKRKAFRPVCRRQTVTIERGDPLFAGLCRALKKLRDTTLRMNRLGHLVRWVQASEKTQVATQKMSKSGFSLSDKESRFSLTVKQGFDNTNSRSITTEEVFKS